MKKFLVATVIIVAGLMITANAADAHVHEVSASCEDGVSVNLTKYADGNTVAVSIDDRTVLTGFEGEHSSNLSNPDKTVAHTWSVVVTSGDGVGAFTESGTIEACETRRDSSDHDDHHYSSSEDVFDSSGGGGSPTAYRGLMRTVDEWSEIAEAAFDDFKEARRKFANTKADYEHKRLSVKAQSDAKSQTARDSEAEVAAHDEKVALIRAESSLDIAESYLKLAQNEMVAAMSIRKYAGGQDGGGMDW